MTIENSRAIETQKSDTFGEGVFDDDPAQEVVSQEVEQEPEPIVLTDREIAIAEGRDPDESKEEFQSKTRQGKAGDEETEVDAEASDDEEEDEVLGPQWSKAEKQLAAKYGISDDELDEFGTSSAFSKAVEVLERASSKTAVEGGDPSSSSEDQEDSAGSAEQSAEVDAATDSGTPGLLQKIAALKKIDVSKYADYDSDDQEIVNHVRQTQDVLGEVTDVMAQMMQVIQGYQHKDVEIRQERAAETLNRSLSKYPDLYGDDVDNLSKERRDAREAVQQQAEIIYQGYVAKGGDLPSTDEIIEKAIRATHGDQLPKSQPTLAQREARLKKQSNQRRSPGQKAAATKRVVTNSDDPASIASDPELVEMFNSFQVENGAV